MNNLRLFYIVVVQVFMFFISYHYGNVGLQAQQFKGYGFNGLVSQRIPLDSVELELNSIYKKAVNKKDTVTMVNSLLSLSALGRNKLKYGVAFNNAGEALFLAEQTKNGLLTANAQEEYAVLNYLFKQDAEAGQLFKLAHKNFKQAHKNGKISNAVLYKSYANLMLYYQRIIALDSLKMYIDSCEIFNKKLTNKLFNSIQLQEKRAFVLGKNKKYDEAISLLNRAEEELKNGNSTGSEAGIFNSFLIVLNGEKGSLYKNEGDLLNAIVYFEKAVQIEDVHNEFAFYRSYVFEQLGLLLHKTGNSEKGFSYLLKSKEINDVFLNPRNENTHGFITFRNRYKDQLVRKTAELQHKDLELIKKSKEILDFKIVFYAVMFSFIIIILLIIGRIRFVSNKKKERDSNELLQHKNQELTVHMLHLIEREEVIKELSEHLKNAAPENTSKNILKSIDSRSDSLWESFNTRFTSQNADFYERLQKKVPDLSSADLKICALIKLNFSGKEMAYLLGISLGSVHVARHRLRKKMNLERDSNLTKFINAI